MGLIGSLTGSDARHALDASKRQADKALQKGYDEGLTDVTAGVDTLRPGAESAGKNQKFYDDLMGLNGPEARAAAQAVVSSDPQFQGQLAQSSNALLRGLNATGAATGGKAQRAGAEVLTKTYGSWIDRYGNAAANGQNATNALASGLASRGDFKYGFGATKAGNEINFGNARAAASQIGGQNFLSGVGMAIQLAKPTPTPA